MAASTYSSDFCLDHSGFRANGIDLYLSSWNMDKNVLKKILSDKATAFLNLASFILKDSAVDQSRSDHAIIGTVLSTRVSEIRDRTMIMWEFSDLKETRLRVTLFGDLQEKKEYTQEGSVWAILNPHLKPKDPQYDLRMVDVADTSTLMNIGTVSGLMQCKGVTQRGTQCKNIMYSSLFGEYCKYHVNQFKKRKKGNKGENSSNSVLNSIEDASGGKINSVASAASDNKNYGNSTIKGNFIINKESLAQKKYRMLDKGGAVQSVQVPKKTELEKLIIGQRSPEASCGKCLFGDKSENGKGSLSDVKLGYKLPKMQYLLEKAMKSRENLERKRNNIDCGLKFITDRKPIGSIKSKESPNTLADRSQTYPTTLNIASNLKDKHTVLPKIPLYCDSSTKCVSYSSSTLSCEDTKVTNFEQPTIMAKCNPSKCLKKDVGAKKCELSDSFLRWWMQLNFLLGSNNSMDFERLGKELLHVEDPNFQFSHEEGAIVELKKLCQGLLYHTDEQVSISALKCLRNLVGKKKKITAISTVSTILGSDNCNAVKETFSKRRCSPENKNINAGEIAPAHQKLYDESLMQEVREALGKKSVVDAYRQQEDLDDIKKELQKLGKLECTEELKQTIMEIGVPAFFCMQAC
ncbi:hypothetical protein IE077_000788 [Cardiosporidium cionae]|uniref:Zinc finger Mcm10/DnaG-type domain-containing protein n=1 Tax=Cardiosporidium cionae TaxID=476202 RepID=A0ABQ7JDZ2_9APIC|nr:hypothetical protein IE077_000788 [Cardiosporidium cionae]|eukprot:KAF8822219.1 hypothetical protein IE077_000788 [Cardiosporidium cionae]